jgi:C4-dicarboxylate-specific signal transduction histidine kinase
MRRSSELAAVREDVEEEEPLPAEEKRIEHLQREAALGRLASGLLHDVNQPATLAIMSSSELARCILDLNRELEDAPETVRKTLRHMQELTTELDLAMQHLRSLVRDARSFGGPSEAIRCAVDTNQLVATACRLVRRDVEEHAELRQSLGDVPPVFGEPARLLQVLVNLLLNAGQAVERRSRGSGRVSIATRAANGHVLIEVRDDGCGVSPALRDSLFSPFASTRQGEGGMGLGLWLASRIVQSHGGKLDFDSVVGEGTRFIVELPAARIGA